MVKFYRSFCLIYIILLLSACGQRNHIKPHQSLSIADLSALNLYQLFGKMSFSDGQDGGSGTIKWQQMEDGITATLKAPLGSKSWQIIESKSGAKLVTHQGEEYFGDSTGVLLSHQLGWQVPWQQLTDWVKGQPHDSSTAKITWQDDTYTLTEGDWQIVYSKLKQYPGGLLPHKMIARNDSYSIKLMVKQWSW